MTPSSLRSRRLFAVTCCIVLLRGALAAETPTGVVPDGARPLPELVAPANLLPTGSESGRSPLTGLTSLRRLVRQFDFEDPEDFPTEMPRAFARVLTETGGPPGFPPFGHIELVEGGVGTGKWCLQMRVDGASIAAAVPRGTVPVFPHADYALLANVRTDGLEHAGARAVVRLLDRDGAVIPFSEHASPLIRTGGAWTTIAVNVPGDFDRAVDLVFELQVLQPRDMPGREGGPAPIDIRGSAFFDEVEVWRIPRVDLSTGAPENVFQLPARPELEIALHDLAAESVEGELVVRDVDGRVLQRESVEPARGGGLIRVPFRPMKAGWYTVQLNVGENGRVIVSRSLDLALLPAGSLARRTGNGLRFGVDVRRTPTERLDAMVVLASVLGLDRASLSLWDPVQDALSRGPRWPRLRTAIDALLDRRIEPTVVVDDVPSTVAGAMGIDPADLLHLFEPGRAIAPVLQEILIDLGQHVQRWQLGRDGRLAAMEAGGVTPRLAGAEHHLASLMPGPVLAVPWPGEHALDPALEHEQQVLIVPAEVTPTAIAEYLASWEGDPNSIRDPERGFDLHFAATPDDLYTVRDRLDDLMLRTLHAWRSGARSVSIDAPWRWVSGRRSTAMPAPEFAVWRQLATWLRDRRFGGEVRLADGIHCWIAEGGDRSALVAWNESAPADAIVAVDLGADPIVIVDAFGNRNMVPPREGVHFFHVPTTPILIDGVDMPLARFRAGFAVTPSLVPSMHREHQHEMTIRNPWPVAISGTVRVLAPETWNFNPRVLPFNAPAGGEARLPLIFSFSRNELAGPKIVQVRAEFTATREYAVTLEAPVMVGFNGVDVDVSWRLARNLTTGTLDLVVTQTVTNRGEEFLGLEAFVIAPGYGQMRKRIPELAPGQTAQRVFQLPDGSTTLAGESIRVGVLEVDGPARLTKEIELPALGSD